MKLEIGDIVICPGSGPHTGPRVGKIKQMTKHADGKFGNPVLVGYIDYPEEPAGWFCGYGAWIDAVRKVEIKNS